MHQSLQDEGIAQRMRYIYWICHSTNHLWDDAQSTGNTVEISTYMYMHIDDMVSILSVCGGGIESRMAGLGLQVAP